MTTNFEEHNPEMGQQAAAAQSQQTQQQQLSLQEIQQRGYCNWCRNPLIMSATFTESNFVDTQKSWHGGTAQAVYCTDCLNIPDRVNEPKSVLDRTTFDEANLEDLPES